MKRTVVWHRSRGLAASAALVFCASSLSAQQFTLPWATVDGGGGLAVSTGGLYSVEGTVGQPDATVMAIHTNGGQALAGGFWALYAVLTDGPPVLAIAAAPSNTVMVSWPAYARDFDLEENTNGLTVAQWQSVATNIVDDSVTRWNHVEPASGARFYRLHQP